MRYKRGDTRDSPDGKTHFWQYDKTYKTGEVWKTEAEYNAKLASTKSNMKAWHTENAESQAKYRKEYRENHRDYFRDKQREYYPAYKEKRKAYKLNNKGKVNTLNAKRRASKLQRTPQWLTEFDHTYIQALYSLASMRTKESGEDWHVDHIIPLQGKLVSGLHVPNNLRVVPASVNLSKNNKFDTDSYTHTYI